MNWTLLDFVTFGVMLTLAGGPVLAAMLLSRSFAYRAGVVIAAGAAFMVIWSALAVGIIADEQNDANLLYLAALLILPLGAIIFGFKAHGMATATFATAGALVAIGAAALAFSWGADAQDTLLGVAIGSGFFPALFAGSGWFFLQAAKTSARAV